jgi:hypothetical protein
MGVGRHVEMEETQADPEDRNLEKAKGMLDKNGTHSQSAQFDVGVHPTFTNPDPGTSWGPAPGKRGWERISSLPLEDET